MKTKPIFILFFVFLPFLFTSCQYTNTQDLDLTDWDDVSLYRQGDTYTYVFNDAGFRISFPCLLELSDTTQSREYAQSGRYYTGKIAEDDPENFTIYNFNLERRSKILRGKKPSDSEEEQYKELRKKVKSYSFVEEEDVVDFNHPDGPIDYIRYEGLYYHKEENESYTDGYIFIKDDLVISFIVTSKKDAGLKWEEIFRTFEFIDGNTDLSFLSVNGIRQSFPFGYSFVVPDTMQLQDTLDGNYYYSTTVPDIEDSLQSMRHCSISFIPLPKPYDELTYEDWEKIDLGLFSEVHSSYRWESYVRVPYDYVERYSTIRDGYDFSGAYIRIDDLFILIELSMKEVDDELRGREEVAKILNSIRMLF